jgi:hypothetical protein
LTQAEVNNVRSGRAEVVRVYLLDGSYKAIRVDPYTTTIESLWEIAAEKLMLTPYSAQVFFIWARNKDFGAFG